MKTADSATITQAGAQVKELNNVELKAALLHFENMDWNEQVALFKKHENLEDQENEADWPEMTFSVGGCQLGVSRHLENENFSLEICVPRPKTLFGLFSKDTFFEFENVESIQAKKYLQMFFTLGEKELYDYFKSQERFY